MELKSKNTGAYDIIVSTVPIPYENIDCVTVSPLLDTEDVKQIKHQLTRKIPLILRKKRMTPKNRSRFLICFRLRGKSAITQPAFNIY